MMNKWTTLVALFIAAISITSCSQNNPIAPSFAPEQGKMVFALDAASENIASGQVTIAKGALTHVLPITIVEHAGSVTFNTVQVGHWNIQVQLFDADGTEIYSGDGTAVVTKNQTTTVNVRVNQNTGTLSITIEVPVQEIFPEGLVAYWKFNEASGTTITDQVNSITGTLFGPSWATGIAGGALLFDALGEYIIIPDAPSLNPTSQISCEAWIKLTSNAPAWGTALLEKGGFTGGQNGYGFFVGNWGMDNTLRFEVFSPWRLMDSVTSLPLNQWNHVVATYDGSSMKIYINGQLDNTAAISSPINIGNTAILGIGMRFVHDGVDPAQPNLQFPGFMDEIAIYNRAITAEEVLQHYNNGLKGWGYFEQ